ncbi:unnamed protein product [Cercospora beticola]|nr:unnamed protein product [Cercospora beticola]
MAPVYYRSREKDLDIPQLDLLTLLFVVTESTVCLAKEDTKVHVEAVNPHNFVTKSDARDLVKRVAYALREEFDVGRHAPGKDVVLSICNGSVFLPNLFYAVLAAGGIFSSASTSFTAPEIARQIDDGGASVLVCSADCLEVTIAAAKLSGIAAQRIIVLDNDRPGRFRLLQADNSRDVLAACKGQKLNWPRIEDPKILASQTIALLYSSGTTGLPKGVRIAHQGLVANLVVTMHVARKFKKRDPTFRFDTIAHLPMGIAGIDMYSTNPFYMGGTTYWMPKYEFNAFIEYHRRYRPGFQFTVPPVWLRIAKSAEVTDHFDGLRVATTGSAPLGYATAQQVRQKLGRGNALMTQTYGTTETSGSVCSQDYHIVDETWSVGDLCPNTTARLVDEQDQDVAPNEPGELLLAGPILSQGYHNRPDINKDAFLDGFYRTGDIATIINNRVYIVDRKKELIKYKAMQIAPAELEALLISHPKIADAAVIGVWDADQQTEVPRAYVVHAVGASNITEKEVRDFVKNNLAPYKQLRGGMVFLPEIPKSMSGKILRKELRAAAEPAPRPKL